MKKQVTPYEDIYKIPGSPGGYFFSFSSMYPDYQRQAYDEMKRNYEEAKRVWEIEQTARKREADAD